MRTMSNNESKKQSIDYIIEEYEKNKDDIPQNYKEFFKKYTGSLEKQKQIPRKKGDRKFILGEWTTPELKYLKDNQWVFTEKIDGTNIRIM